MHRRIYYPIREDGTAFDRVLLIEHPELTAVSVYCPAIDGNRPWIQPHDDFYSAIELAASLAKSLNQPAVLMTRDTTPWWLNGLADGETMDDIVARET